MNWKGSGIVLTIALTILLGLVFPQRVSAQTSSYGPRSPELKLFYFADESSLYTALKAGAIDLSLWECTQAQYQDAKSDPNIVLSPAFRLDMRAFSLNNNETIAAYPGVRIATSYIAFRKALWCLCDVAYYTEVICGGFAAPLYVPVSAPSRAWVNITVENWAKINYAFSVQKAAELLDAEGFVQGTDLNPYYKPDLLGSAQYWRVYPAGHSKAGQKIDPVIFSARVDDSLRYSASVHLRDRMLESGIPVNFISENGNAASIRVMAARNYMIYSAGWTTGRFATYLYSFFHTNRWIAGGSNYHISTTSPGYITTPGDADNLDEAVDRIQYPPNLDDALEAAKNAQRVLVQKYASFIPLWGGKAFYAYRNLLGVTNMESIGPENIYTFLNAWRADGGAAIRMGHKLPPTQVNQIYASWVWDVTTMGQTQDGYISLEPYNILNDQPFLAQDWTTAPGGSSSVPGTWVDSDDGKIKSVMRYWFRDDAEWIKPVTGEVLASFVSHWLGGGYEFDSWYFDSEPAGWIYTGYRDIKHIECNSVGKYVDVYFDVASYWSQYWPWGRHIYSNQSVQDTPNFPGWKQAPLSSRETRTFAGPIPAGTFLHTLTPLEGAAYKIPKRMRGTPVEIIEVKLGDVLLAKATTPHLFNPATGLGAGGDYSIVGSTANGPGIRVFKAVPSDGVLTVKYWARGDAAGYHPGNLGWDKTLAGTGMFYMTDFLAGVGGWATYKANRQYFMATPNKGEIDWYWNWIGATQPRDGSYQANIYDATYANWGLGGSGKAVPTANWIEATDLASPIGETDIYDVAVLASHYGKNFGSPPPNPPP